jgi:hypothetical protein
VRSFLSAFLAIAASSIRPPVLPLGSLFGFGVLIPLRHGFDFLDAPMVLAYAFIPMLFVASPVAFGISRAWNTYRRLLTWVGAATLFGWCIGLLFLATALASLNVAARPAPIQLPSLRLVLTYAGFCFSAVWFVSSIAAYLAILFSPTWSRQILRVGFLVLLSCFYIGPAALPRPVQLELTQWNHLEMAWWGGAILSLAAAGLTWSLQAGVVTSQRTAATPSSQSSNPL